MRTNSKHVDHVMSHYPCYAHRLLGEGSGDNLSTNVSSTVVMCACMHASMCVCVLVS